MSKKMDHFLFLLYKALSPLNDPVHNSVNNLDRSVYRMTALWSPCRNHSDFYFIALNFPSFIFFIIYFRLKYIFSSNQRLYSSSTRTDSVRFDQREKMRTNQKDLFS